MTALLQSISAEGATALEAVKQGEDGEFSTWCVNTMCHMLT
jgi:hypothetical protein